ncbi:MAG: ParB/RepB/Spo0J family partition protein [Fibrobacterota bacterium]
MSSKGRRALGKGLDSLFSSTLPEDEPGKGGESQGQSRVLIKEIVVNPFQPRTDFDEESIEELARSIDEQGLIQPIVLRRSGEVYQIISGERRYRAVGRLGWKKIPAIIREDVDDSKMLELAMVENVQRVDLNALEIAVSYKRLLEDCGLSHKDISERVGKSRSAITNFIRLLKLTKPVQELVRTQKLSMGHARALLSVESAEKQKELAELIVSQGLSVRAAETAIARNTRDTSVQKKKSPKHELGGFEEKWKGVFRTKIRITADSGGKGRVEIPFKGKEELEQLTALIAGMRDEKQ